MEMLKIRANDQVQEKERVLETETVQAFADDFQGELLQPGEEGYDEARSIWNAMIQKQPAAIARCTGTADVVAAVNFARSHNLLLSVRGGGHNVAGHATCDRGLMVDLSQMKDVTVNPRRRTARARPGADLGDLDRETQLHGLATPTGIVSKTGLAGLTLGGGFGWLTRKYGFTCDNLISAEVVTAEGEVVWASEEQNADLFWGLRGGGGNFGIVTSFEYQLHPVGPTVLAGLLLHSLENAGRALRFYRDFASEAPDELGSLAVFRLAPSAPFVPDDQVGEPVLGLLVCYAGDIDEGRRLLRPLREFGPPLADLIEPKSYVELQAMLDQGQPEGKRYYSKSEYLAGLSDQAIDAIVKYGADMTSPLGRLAVMQLGGAASRIDEMAMAASHRDAGYVVAINNGWEDSTDSEVQIEWTREAWSAIRPFSTGTYVNFVSAQDDQERVKAAYGEEKYARLVEIKNEYDPDNFFRINQNIEPSG